MPPLCLERYGVRYDGGLAAHVLPSIYAGDAVWFSDDHQTWKLVERAVEGDDVVLYERVPAKGAA